MARDVSWGAIGTRDGRQTYIPEVKQTDYDIPREWEDCLDEPVELPVTATYGEWANILMMPAYCTLAACQELTQNFRTAYLAIAHDVMLRRMKKSAYKYARKVEAERKKDSDISADEDYDLPVTTPGPQQPRQSGSKASDYEEFKKLKDLVAPRETQESLVEYLKRVWELMESTTDNEEAKRLWFNHVTGHPYGKGTPVSEHYHRLVLEDITDEDAFLERCRTGLDQGRTLSQVWYDIKAKVSPNRFVKALRVVTRGRRNEVAFVKLPSTGSTLTQLERAVVSWDLENKFYEDKRRKEARPSPKAADRAVGNSAPTPSPAKRNEKQGADRNRAYNTTSPQQRQRRDDGPVKRSNYLPPEEYKKLTPEERDALRAARQTAAEEQRK